jgi:hypothetical protein
MDLPRAPEGLDWYPGDSQGDNVLMKVGQQNPQDDEQLDEGLFKTDDENLVQMRARLLQEELAVDPDWLEKDMFGADTDEELFGTDKKDDKKDEDLVSLM